MPLDDKSSDSPPVLRFENPKFPNYFWTFGPRPLEFDVLRSKNLELEGFNILGLSVKLTRCLKSRFGGLKI